MYEDPENINLENSPAAPHKTINLHDAPAAPHEHFNLQDARTASDHGHVDDVANPRDVDPVSSLAPEKPHNAKGSVFYCKEGCFNLSSPCTHIRVTIPRSTKV